MTALLREEPDEIVSGSTTADQVGLAIRPRSPVDLPTLESNASLLTRVDRKYVVPVETFMSLGEVLDERWHVLEIEGRRQFGYVSVYFDTPDLVTYRAHLQGRRLRFKVRVRSYVDSGDRVLEVKRKGLRERTEKERREHVSPLDTDLGEEGRAFVSESLAEYGIRVDVRELQPVLVTTHRRACLVSLADHARLTIDADVSCGWNHAGTRLRSGHVILESKAEGSTSSTVDTVLRQMGVRPVKISKYCVGVASLGGSVPSNPWRRTINAYFEPQSQPGPCPD
jgi:VTC domain